MDRPFYRNFAFENYVNYPDHSSPYTDRPRSYYGSMGDFLITGYELYSWQEDRVPGQTFGSAIFKDFNPWIAAFDNMSMARDGYGTWGYSMIVGDAQVARFSPLTISMANFNGLRFDLATSRWSVTALASRIERPRSYVESIPTWSLNDVHFADDSTLLLGSRIQTELGNLTVGLNGVNLHVYQSTQPGNSLKGRLRPDMALINWIVVRFSDDSPGDGIGGPVVQEVRLVVNGEQRPDMQPAVIKHATGIGTQVGSVSRATGEFRPLNYSTFSGYQTQHRYYRGRREVPLYGDYLYRLDHEAGLDVSGDANLAGLLREFSVENPGLVQRADGSEALVYMWELTNEPHVESVEVEALLGNDYRVEVAILDRENDRARNYPTKYRSTFYTTTHRARGNVQDLSNLRRIRVPIGENTALFTYSADMNFALAGFEVNAELARSSRYSRFPAQLDGAAMFRKGARSVTHGTAYFANATRWFGDFRLGGEYFALNPDFNTTMRTFVPFEVGLTEGNLAGLANDTVYWDLVEDNDDGDLYPDSRIGNLPGLPNDRADFDVNGVFPGQDDDRDGFPDTNRNGNQIPDYEEPFLMYDVEPIDYVYGLDRNNNDEPDVREDDNDFDYPYDMDQRGYHLYGERDLGHNWSMAVGRYDVEQIAGSGRNKVTYGLLSQRWTGLSTVRKVVFENNLRRVKDDIRDEFNVLRENPRLNLNFDNRGLSGERVSVEESIPVFLSTAVADPLGYENSYVNESYFEIETRPWTGLELEQKVRLRLNWQQEVLKNGAIEQRERRLDFWTWVSKVRYEWGMDRLRVVPQYKFLLLRLKDQDADRQADGSYKGRLLRNETRSIPILRLEYTLTPRTRLQAGWQGIGPVSYRVRNHIRDSESYKQRTFFLNLINRSQYFGYDLYTIVGARKSSRKYDDPFRRGDGFDQWSFFVRGLIGFTEYGRPL